MLFFFFKQEPSSVERMLIARNMCVCGVYMITEEFKERSLEKKHHLSAEDKIAPKHQHQEACHEDEETEQVPGARYLGRHPSQMGQNQCSDQELPVLKSPWPGPNRAHCFPPPRPQCPALSHFKMKLPKIRLFVLLM